MPRYDRFPIEICIDSLDSAAAAYPHMRPADGDRFEVCSSLISGGGLTPSIGLVRRLRQRYPDVELMVMIRPRPGSFVYTKLEGEVMNADIVSMAAAGATGVVFGCLTAEGQVDVLTAKLAHTAKNNSTGRQLKVTFHRAFDVTPEWPEAFLCLAGLENVDRILTSGHAGSALEGAKELADLTIFVPLQAPHLTILPASGINAESFSELLERVPELNEVHLSASSALLSPVMASAPVRRGAELGFGSGEEWRLDPAKLAAMRQAVDEAIEERHSEYGPDYCDCPECEQDMLDEDASE